VIRVNRPPCNKSPSSNEVPFIELLTRASKLAISPLPAPTVWYAIPLRLIVGFGFMEHGYTKLARGPEDFVNILHAIGVPGAFLVGWATIIIEIIGGFLIVARLFLSRQYQWSSSCLSQYSRCTSRTALVRSSSNPSMLLALILGSLGSRRTFLSIGAYRAVFGGHRSTFSRWTFEKI
jgi:DoxX